MPHKTSKIASRNIKQKLSFSHEIIRFKVFRQSCRLWQSNTKRWLETTWPSIMSQERFDSSSLSFLRYNKFARDSWCDRHEQENLLIFSCFNCICYQQEPTTSQIYAPKNIYIGKQLFWKIAKSVDKDSIGTGKKPSDNLTRGHYLFFLILVSSPSKNHYTKLNKTVIAYKNATFGSPMKGKVAAPTKRVTEAIRRLARQDGYTEFAYVDEYLTN
ncbi:hypothetical protein BD560DRAFT_424445 [Blakeslea trispora]|nr:hypothetical protein BD560DRAFT_424445 [Blakeslea trispora]